MLATFLRPGDQEWSRILQETRHDVYHLPEYTRASALHQDGQPAAFFAEDDSGALLIPLLVQPIPHHDGTDVTSPYGYPSPLWTTPDPSPHWSAFSEVSRDRNIVSAFIRLHPLLPLPTSSDFTTHSGAAIVEHGPTVWIDCEKPPEAMWNDTRPDHRSDIRRLERQGYRVEVASDADALDNTLGEFISIYRETMDRVEADPFYYFSESYFESWTRSLHPYCHIAIVRGPNDEAAAAGLFTERNGWMQFHLSGTASSHRALAPSKLMIHEIRTRAHEAGNPRLHLGGGLGADTDSIFKFKAGFSSSRATFNSLRIICDRDRYDTISPEDAPAPSKGFFPAYRKENV